MKHLLIVAASLLLGHAAWSAPVVPTYLKMVVTDNAGHGGTCQISRLADGTDLIGNRRASGAMDIGCYEAAQGMMIYVR